MQSSRYHKRSRLELFTRATIAHRWLSRQPFLSQDQHLVRKCVFNPCLDRVLTRTVGKHINIESATEVARYLSKFALACGETLQTMEEAIFTSHDTKEKKKNLDIQERRQAAVDFCFDIALPQAVNMLDLWEDGVKELAKAVFFSVPPTEGTRQKSTQHYANFVRNLKTNCPQYHDLEMTAKQTFTSVTVIAQHHREEYNNKYKEQLKAIVENCIRVQAECTLLSTELKEMNTGDHFKIQPNSKVSEHVQKWTLFSQRYIQSAVLMERNKVPPYFCQLRRAIENSLLTGLTAEIDSIFNKIMQARKRGTKKRTTPPRALTHSEETMHQRKPRAHMQTKTTGDKNSRTRGRRRRGTVSPVSRRCDAGEPSSGTKPGVRCSEITCPQTHGYSDSREGCGSSINKEQERH